MDYYFNPSIDWGDLNNAEIFHLKNTLDHPITTTGPYAGFTRLHHACMEDNLKRVKFLLEISADVNVVAEDGTQPIHIAFLLEHEEIAVTLIYARANVNAEISEAMFLKYAKNRYWCSDFGDKMTLLTFAGVIPQKTTVLVRTLIHHHEKAKFEMISLRNKPIIRYVFENNFMAAQLFLKSGMNYERFINIRDDDGYIDIHYLLSPRIYHGYRYVALHLKIIDTIKGTILSGLINAGADIYATRNGDPNTLLINMAAYRSSIGILRELLPCYTSLTGSRALYYATIQPGNPNIYFYPYLSFENRKRSGRVDENVLNYHRKTSQLLIIKDLINRITFGLPVPEKEKKLMDTLYATDKDIRNIIDKYKKQVIEDRLKNTMADYGNDSISLYDLVLKSINHLKLRLLVRDQNLLSAFKIFECFERYDDLYYFGNFCKIRVRKAKVRVKLLDELKKISALREAIPLPYECVLEIVEFLRNEDFERFIRSFYTRFFFNVR